MMPMKTQILILAAALAATAQPNGAAKNAILFIGDGAGVSSLNAASIYGYGRAQALYMQGMPHVALADTSTAKEWVTDAAAAATAWATGRKGRNGVVSQSPDAERDTKDGEVVNIHCYLDPAIRVGEMHEVVDAVERGLRQRFPEIKRVIGHAEPR